jgi:hypothetical protein
VLCWFLFVGINQFPFPVNGEYSDYAISHYPNLLYTKDSITTWHQLPLWSNAILSGYPYLADPLSSIWYPPYWLAIALPTPWGLNLLTILHLVLGAFGMVYFFRLMGVSEIPAVAGAIVFLLMPKMIAHLGAGHITLVWAVTLTPWLLVFEMRGRKASGVFQRIFLPGLLSGLVILADVRWAAFCWVLWWCYGLFSKDEKRNGSIWIKAFWKGLVTKFIQSIIGLFFASPLLLPLLQFIQLSTRKMMSSADTLTLSLPPGNLFGLIFPNLGGSAEWMTYFGALPILLFITLCASRTGWKMTRFWLIVFFISIIFSLGSYIPGIQIFASLPGFDLLRVPPRALFLAGISLSVVTAIGLEEFWHSKSIKTEKGMRLILSGSILLVLLLTVVFSIKSSSGRLGFLWGGTTFVLAGIILLLVSYRKSKALPFYLLTAILIADLSFVSYHEIQFRKSAEVFESSNEEVSIVKNNILSNSRIYSPSYSIPQEAAMKAELQLADGVNPLQLESYVKYMAIATGIHWEEYSVTLPAFRTGSPDKDNAGVIPDAELLGILNVQMIVSAFPIQEDNLKLEAQTADAYMYLNGKYRPRAWIQGGLQIDADGKYQEAAITLYSPNHIQVNAEGPGVLVLADPYYPGWIAKINGKKGSLLKIDGLLRGVELTEGQHTIDFIFRPVLLYIGLLFQGCVLLIFCIFAFSRQKRKDP